MHPSLQWIKTLGVDAFVDPQKKLAALVSVQPGMDRMARTRTRWSSTILSFRFVLTVVTFGFLTACASEPGAENPASSAPTKADIKARDEFARNLPKPPER